VISSEALTSLIQLHVGIKSDRRKEEIMKKKHARLLILILVGLMAAVIFRRKLCFVTQRSRAILEGKRSLHELSVVLTHSI